MALLKVEGVTHWSIPVNNLDESEQFYGDLLGLKHLGRLGNSGMSCFNVGDHNILLCERAANIDKSFTEDQNVHHSFTVAPETLVQACKIFKERKFPSIGFIIEPRGFLPAANCISLIRAVIAWNCAIRLGRPACRNRVLTNWRNRSSSPCSERVCLLRMHFGVCRSRI